MRSIVGTLISKFKNKVLFELLNSQTSHQSSSFVILLIRDLFYNIWQSTVTYLLRTWLTGSGPAQAIPEPSDRAGVGQEGECLKGSQVVVIVV